MTYPLPREPELEREVVRALRAHPQRTAWVLLMDVARQGHPSDIGTLRVALRVLSRLRIIAGKRATWWLNPPPEAVAVALLIEQGDAMPRDPARWQRLATGAAERGDYASAFHFLDTAYAQAAAPPLRYRIAAQREAVWDKWIETEAGWVMPGGVRLPPAFD